MSFPRAGKEMVMDYQFIRLEFISVIVRYHIGGKIAENFFRSVMLVVSMVLPTVPEFFLAMEFGLLEPKAFLNADFLLKFPGEKRLKLYHKSFTIFFTTSKEICHLDYTLGTFLHHMKEQQHGTRIAICTLFSCLPPSSLTLHTSPALHTTERPGSEPEPETATVGIDVFPGTKTGTSEPLPVGQKRHLNVAS